MDDSENIQNKYFNKITGKSITGEIKFFIESDRSNNSCPYEACNNCEQEKQTVTNHTNIKTSEYFKYTSYNSEKELIDNMQKLTSTLCFLKQNDMQNTEMLSEIKRILKYMVNSDNFYGKLGVDTISVKIGVKLIKYVNPEEKTGTLLPKINWLREKLTYKYGYIIPNVRVLDNSSLNPAEYKIFIRGKEVFQSIIDLKTIPKKKINDVIIENLEDVCMKYVEQIFTKTHALKLMELVKVQDPTLVNDLVPLLISAIDLKQIFINLIKQKVSIKDIVYVFELLNFHAQHTQNTDKLTKLLIKDLNFAN